MTNLQAKLPQQVQAGLYNACDGALYIVNPQSAVNLCTNPSFETDLNNWAIDGFQVLARQNAPWSGAWNLRWTNYGANTYLTYGGITPLSIGAPSTQYAVSFYVKTATAYNVTMTVEVFSGVSTVVAKWSMKLTKDWQRFVGVSLITVATTYKIRISCNVLTPVLIDAVQVEKVVGHGATTYFDGSTTGTIINTQIASPQYAWYGKAHASASVRNENAGNGGLPINLQNELGFQLIGISGADNPTPNNQIVNFNANDGASLQDITIPQRTVTFVGIITGTSAVDLHRKIQLFSKYFVRDTTASRQPKSFIFQHKNGRENIGQPLFFSGVIQDTMQIPLSNAFSIQISVSILMLDPYFYGNDECATFSDVYHLLDYSSVFSFIPNYTQPFDTSAKTYLQATQTIVGTITAIVVAPNGIVYFGGKFSNIAGVTINKVAKYDPISGVITKLGSAYTGLNNHVNALAISPDGEDLWIGGEFTATLGGTPNVSCNYIVRYNIATDTYNTFGAGAGGGVNGFVNTIAIKTKRLTNSGGGYQYDVYIGGAFTTANAVPMYRMAHTSQTANTWLAFGTGSGMNGDIYSLAYNNNLDRIYIGGAFTTSQAGVANAFTGICYVNLATLGTTVAFYTGVNVAAGGYVYAIYTNDTDNSLIIGGSFTATFAGASLLRAATFNGTVWQQVDTGFSDGIVYEIQPYRNGYLLAGTFTTSNSVALFGGVAWFNGQMISPIPAYSGPSLGFQACCVSPYGQVYLGQVFTGFSQVMTTGILSGVTNNGTVAATINWVIYQNDTAVTDFTVSQIMNATQQTQVSFKLLPITYKEIVTIDTKSGTVVSDIMGNQLRYMLGAGITNLTILPGFNFLCIMINMAATFSNTITIVAFWKKTYANIFDGVNAQ